MAKPIQKLNPKEINKKINEMAFYMYQSMGTTKELFIETFIEALIDLENTEDYLTLRVGNKDKKPIHIIHTQGAYVYFTVTKDDKVEKHYATSKIPIFINA